MSEINELTEAKWRDIEIGMRNREIDRQMELIAKASGKIEPYEKRLSEIVWRMKVIDRLLAGVAGLEMETLLEPARKK